MRIKEYLYSKCVTNIGVIRKWESLADKYVSEEDIVWAMQETERRL
jgi:hypothetical protein